MPIQELTQEQIHEMTLKQKDEWWLKNIYRGNMPQLNLRSALTGMILGGVLSLTNLYIGIKTGWTLGVGISSVVISFGFYNLLARLRLGKEMSILENNAMQSIATSAGYMTAPLMASIPAYMMVTGEVIPMWQTFWWIVVLAILGVLFAFPLKKRFINDEQLPFPEGYAAGIVLDSLHNEHGKAGMFKAKLLMFAAGLSALIEIMRSEAVMTLARLKSLTLPGFWDDLIYGFVTPKILNSPLKDLTIRLDSSIVMMGTGGLMSMKTAMSILLGGFINYFICAPILIDHGIIPEATFKAIAMWSLVGWGCHHDNVFALFFFLQTDRSLSRHSFARLKSGELLRKMSSKKSSCLYGFHFVGIPLVERGRSLYGSCVVWNSLLAGFDRDSVWCLLFTLIAVTATGLTAITPGGALGKLTQISLTVFWRLEM
jgi:hypothetical protein